MEENKNTITYEENWNTISQSEYPEVVSVSEYDEENETIVKEQTKRKTKNAKNSPKQLLITIQLIVCIIIALGAFIIRGIGGNIYIIAREFYYSNLSNSAIFDTYISTPDLPSILGLSTDDEAENR